MIITRKEEESWSESYDGLLEDIFAIQSEVAENIANELKATLTTNEEYRITRLLMDGTQI